MDGQGWVPISSIADFKRVSPRIEILLNFLFIVLNIFIFDYKSIHALSDLFTNYFLHIMLILCLVQLKKMCTDIPFILDALQASISVEVQVNNP